MMKRNKRIGTVGATVLLAMAASTTVEAQTDRCHSELVKASGRATILGMGRARRLAIDNWQREVRQKYGERFMDFTYARQAKHECESASIGTLGQLNKRCNVSAYPCAAGSVADDVEMEQGIDSTFAIQRMLARLSYLEREQVDGEYGPITREAVRNFQRHHRLHVTGEVDEVTLKRLREDAGRRIR